MAVQDTVPGGFSTSILPSFSDACTQKACIFSRHDIFPLYNKIYINFPSIKIAPEVFSEAILSTI